MKKVAMFLAVLFVGAMAQAQVAGPLWTCELQADKMTGLNIGFILSAGGSEAADVTINCTDLEGKTVTKKGAMVLSRIGIGIGISFPKDMSMYTVVTGLADPNELFGNYHIGASANATVVAVEGGVVLSTGLDNGLMLELGLYSGKSIGLSINPLQALFVQIMTPEAFKEMKKKQKEQQNNGGGNH